MKENLLHIMTEFEPDRYSVFTCLGMGKYPVWIMPQLSIIVKKLEKILETEINYSSMTEEEYKYRKSRKDPFITSVLLQPRIMIIGNETKLLS